MGRVRSKQVKAFSDQECKDLTAWVTEDEAYVEKRENRSRLLVSPRI